MLEEESDSTSEGLQSSFGPAKLQMPREHLNTDVICSARYLILELRGFHLWM